MNDDELARETRKQARLEKLGTNKPCCAICGETDWRIFELHHVAGQGRDPTVVPVCANCHRRLTDDQKDHPSSNVDDPQLDRIGHFLLGLADMLRLIVEKLREFGHALIARARSPQTEADQ